MTPAELADHYAAKMREYTDRRIRYELTLRGNDSWASDATMEVWNKCLDAEAARRGIDTATTL
jgi:hypothetical protein